MARRKKGGKRGRETPAKGGKPKIRRLRFGRDRLGRQLRAKIVNPKDTPGKGKGKSAEEKGEQTNN